MDISVGVTERLEEAQKTLGELPGKDVLDNPRLIWLERQLANLVKQLQALLADIEAGCSLTDLGFFGNGEFQEMLDDLDVEMSNLRSLIQTAKMLGR